MRVVRSVRQLCRPLRFLSDSFRLRPAALSLQFQTQLSLASTLAASRRRCSISPRTISSTAGMSRQRSSLSSATSGRRQRSSRWRLQMGTRICSPSSRCRPSKNTGAGVVLACTSSTKTAHRCYAGQ